MVARDRDDHMLGTGPLLLLVYLWTLGDSTSKREAAARAELDACPDHPHGGWSHVTVAHADVLQRSLVARFERGTATIQGWERTLRAAGLMARPSEGVVLLADVEHVGYLPESTPGIRTGGVSTDAPDPRKAEGPTLENSRVDPRNLEGPTLEILRVLIGSPITPDQNPIKTLLSPEASASRPSARA
jgi:hypothetical protein